MNRKLRLTIISDLHCKHQSSDKNADQKLLQSTILYTDLLRKESPPKHPIHSLLQEIKKEKATFKSDLLICPGDITDKIDIQGYITGWSFLEEIKEAITAQEIFVTIGNHDVDSRRTKDIAPFTIAKSIKYNYPIEDTLLQESYWNKNFFIVENEDYILLNFNSSYSHLNFDDARKSIIERDTIILMDEQLSKMSKNKIKISLCHHHPISHSNLSHPDADVIQNGTDFLDMLCKHNFTIAIHGHKHEIKIRYYNDLVVFCSGSFASQDNLKETESENAFHIIDILDKNNGTIKSWFYGSHSGWQQKTNLKFPPLTGFGFRGDISNLALKVNEWFNTKSNGFNDLYSNLAAEINEINLLIPMYQEKLKNILADTYNIEITYDNKGIPKKISKLIQ